MRDSLAGYVEWSEFQCPISAGFHTLKFCYTKNQTKSRGSDCVWIDDISLPGGIGVPPNPNDSTGNTEEVVITDDVEGHVFGAFLEFLPKPEGYVEEKPARGPRREGGDRGPRKDGDRGGRGGDRGHGERRSSGNGGRRR